TLRAHAQLLEARAPAGRARLWNARLAPTAAMADEYVGGLRPPGRWGLRPHVGGLRPPAPGLHGIRKRELAGGTEEHVAAVPPQDNGREPAPVQVVDDLVIGCVLSLQRD